MSNLVNKTKKRVFVKLVAVSIFCAMLLTFLILGLCIPGLRNLGLDYVSYILFAGAGIFYLLAWLSLINLVFNVANIKILSFLDKYIFFFINLLFPLILLLGKLFKIDDRTIERSFINLNNSILEHHEIKVAAKDLLVISPHCLQLASCPHKITHDIRNCKRCNACTVGPLITLSEKMGFHFRVVTGGTLARKMAKELRPRLILAIACERDLTSGIKDVYPLPAVGVLNIRPNGPCYNTSVDIEEVERMLRKFIKQ